MRALCACGLSMRGVAPGNPTTFSQTEPILVPVKTGIPRPVEVVVSLIALVVSIPFLALSAAAIAVISRGPVIFRQERVGLAGRIFVIYKLRTMRRECSGPQVTASDDVRVTWVGRLLRGTKLDELPEFWNVLKGDMSLVGPRPEVPRYIDLENPMWRLVLQAKPGITDPMTLRLRNEEALLTQAQGEREHFYRGVLQPFKLKGYLEYLGERNWRSDVKILWKSGVAVIFPGQAPPPTVDEILSCTNNVTDSAALTKGGSTAIVT
jgi:lipopolysaccharide/colanic/teichoic acid biosynthesis glycosyltransferase